MDSSAAWERSGSWRIWQRKKESEGTVGLQGTDQVLGTHLRWVPVTMNNLNLARIHCAHRTHSACISTARNREVVRAQRVEIACTGGKIKIKEPWREVQNGALLPQHTPEQVPSSLLSAGRWGGERSR